MHLGLHGVRRTWHPSRRVLEGEERERWWEMVKSWQRTPCLSASHLSGLGMRLSMGEQDSVRWGLKEVGMIDKNLH